MATNGSQAVFNIINYYNTVLWMDFFPPQKNCITINFNSFLLIFLSFFWGGGGRRQVKYCHLQFNHSPNTVFSLLIIWLGTVKKSVFVLWHCLCIFATANCFFKSNGDLCRIYFRWECSWKCTGCIIDHYHVQTQINLFGLVWSLNSS